MEHQKETLDSCPICEGKTFVTVLQTKDYFLSAEEFDIQQCLNCNFHFTNPRPNKKAFGSYYKSENYISHSNKSRGAFASLYQYARKINLKSKYSILSRHIKTGKALDIGSGTGHFLQLLKTKGWETRGIEPDENAADFSRSSFNLIIDAESEITNYQKSSFDLISMWHVLEHVHDLNERLDEIKRIISTKGILILALPNLESYDANYYVKQWAALDVPRHLYHFTRKDVENLAQKHNFIIEKIYPMKMDSFYVSLLSEKYIGKKWGLFRAFYIAILSNLKSSRQNPNTSSLIYILRPNWA